MHKHFNLTLLMGAAALLAGCGGGGGDPAPAAADMVPASATVSALAFSQYAGGLAEDDQREPLPVSDLAPPVDDTSEPAPVTR
jgi:hypothetical protein